MYIGSADLMERNLDRRVETLTPVRDEEILAHLRDVVLGSYLRDTDRAMVLDASGHYQRPEGIGRQLQRAAVPAAALHRTEEPSSASSALHEDAHTSGQKCGREQRKRDQGRDEQNGERHDERRDPERPQQAHSTIRAAGRRITIHDPEYDADDIDDRMPRSLSSSVHHQTRNATLFGGSTDSLGLHRSALPQRRLMKT